MQGAKVHGWLGALPLLLSACIGIRIDRAGDHQRIFWGRFIGSPAAAANAIADLVEHGRVDET